MKKFLSIIVILIIILIGIIIYFKPSAEDEVQDEIEQVEVQENIEQAEDSLFDNFDNEPMFDDMEFDEEITEEDSVMNV